MRISDWSSDVCSSDLHHPEYWDLGWVQHSPLAAEYQQMVDTLGDSVRFMETLAGASISDFSRVDFYTSHEALLLWAEQAQTRQVPRAPGGDHRSDERSVGKGGVSKGSFGGWSVH